MVRTQIQLTDEQSRAVKKLARRRGVSVAEFVRRALDRQIDLETARIDELRLRAIAALGCGKSGLGDLSEQHDQYLAEDFAQ